MTAGGPQFRATPQNPRTPLRWSVQVLLLVIAYSSAWSCRPLALAHDDVHGLGDPWGLWGGLLLADLRICRHVAPAMIGVAAVVALSWSSLSPLIVACSAPAPRPEPIAEVAARRIHPRVRPAPAGRQAR